MNQDNKVNNEIYSEMSAEPILLDSFDYSAHVKVIYC